MNNIKTALNLIAPLGLEELTFDISTEDAQQDTMEKLKPLENASGCIAAMYDIVRRPAVGTLTVTPNDDLKQVVKILNRYA